MGELLLVGLGLAGIYLLSCLVWPYTACGMCRGGKHARSDGEVWRKWWRCSGTGRRRRAGAWLAGRGDR